MSRFSNTLISGILHLDELASILYGDLKQNIFRRDPSKGNLFGETSTKTTIESSNFKASGTNSAEMSAPTTTVTGSTTATVTGQTVIVAGTGTNGAVNVSGTKTASVSAPTAKVTGSTTATVTGQTVNVTGTGTNGAVNISGAKTASVSGPTTSINSTTKTTITTPKLNLSTDKVVLKNSLYGTGGPPTSGAVEGQLYFKIIS